MRGRAARTAAQNNLHIDLIPNRAVARELRSWTLQKSQVERQEHQDNSGVHHQPLPKTVPEEQDIHADHDGYQRDHVKHEGRLSYHPSFLLPAAARVAGELRTRSRPHLMLET
jgi:hypothetical protein